jgi:ankyrin repeat protein/CRP-like cAMP-binding protein
MMFMLINIIITSWMIGSITLLIVKQDAKTGAYRDAVAVLNQYVGMHSFDRRLQKNLKTQLNLEFNNRELSDEEVLKLFPSAVRRKVLKRLYLPSLMQTNLMKGVRQQFVDSFLTTCHVEIFSPGEEILQRGSTSADLYLLVGGVVTLLPFVADGVEDPSFRGGDPSFRGGDPSLRGTSVADSDLAGAARDLEPGEFINEVGFLTDSPQVETVRTKTICKTLTVSKSAYARLAEAHPGSVSQILKNLLAKVEAMADEDGTPAEVNLPRGLSSLRLGSMYSDDEAQRAAASVQAKTSLTAVRDLILMHIEKQKDDHTTRFLFAASRGDSGTINCMCEQGFDPNNADYDSRTALMVASMKGNTDTVKTLLGFSTNANLTDMHGTSALYEATRNGHDDTVDLLLQHGAHLCIPDGRAASIMCQAVFDGDTLALRRLLKAGVNVDAADYDKRTAAHIAAAEGSMIALKVLVEFGANLALTDRWNNSVRDEAESANAGHILEYFKTLETGAS